MATKTISLEMDAYDKLKKAKRSDRESFSSVVRRARWDDATPTAGEILEALHALVVAHPAAILPEADLNRIARRWRTGRPKIRWEER
jgi:hypothetical protein